MKGIRLSWGHLVDRSTRYRLCYVTSLSVVPHRVTSASAAMGALLIPAVVNSRFQTILQSPVCQAIIRATVFGWVAGIPDHLIKTLGRYISASIASDSSAPGLMALER
jgi:hypothetical protein